MRVSRGRVLGYDMAAVFALANGLAITPAAVAEFMPLIEAELVAACNTDDDNSSTGWQDD